MTPSDGLIDFLEVEDPPVVFGPARTTLEGLATLCLDQGPPDLDALGDLLPVLHPGHTREMVRSVWADVVRSLARFDIKALLQALESRLAELPSAIRTEVRELMDRLPRLLPDKWPACATRLLALLALALTLASLAAPDSAYAKSAFHVGSEVSVSRPAHFGGEAPPSDRAVQSPGYARFGAGRHEPLDESGHSYAPRTYYYHTYSGYSGSYNSGYGYPGQAPPAVAPPAPHHSAYVADSDLQVLDNADTVVLLADPYYLLVEPDALTLRSQASAEPLAALYRDPQLVADAESLLADQAAFLEREAHRREGWLSWVGWLERVSPSVGRDRLEVANMRDMARRLWTAVGRVRAGARLGAPPPLPGAVELFAGGYVRVDGVLLLRMADGRVQPAHFPGGPGLARVMSQKALRQDQAELASAQHDLDSLHDERAGLERDLQEYSRLAGTYGYSYAVDYGTQEMPASQALERTQQDLSRNLSDAREAQKDIRKLRAELPILTHALRARRQER